MRRNANPIPLRVIPVEPVVQPPLPRTRPQGRPARTRAWWRMRPASPLSAEFTATDWSELLDTAALHAELWSGNVGVAAELRLRVAKFGAAPEGRARLRIQFAAADGADARLPVTSASRERRDPLLG